jgi:ribosomal protein L44E
MIHCIHRALYLPKIAILYCSICGVYGRFSYDKQHWDKPGNGYLIDVPDIIRNWFWPCGWLNEALDTHDFVFLSSLKHSGLPHYKDAYKDCDEILLYMEECRFKCTKCGMTITKDRYTRVDKSQFYLVDRSYKIDIATCSVMKMRKALS